MFNSPIYSQTIDITQDSIPYTATTSKQHTNVLITWTNIRITSLITVVNDKINLFRSVNKGPNYKAERVKIRWQTISDLIRDYTDSSDPFAPAAGACKQKYNKLKKKVSDYHKRIDKSGNHNIDPPWYLDFFMFRQDNIASIIQPVAVSSATGLLGLL